MFFKANVLRRSYCRRSGLITVLFFEFFLLSASRSAHAGDYSSLREGDIIFHTSRSSQSQAIQLSTHSKYSHVGVIFRKNKQLVVLEAVQPVKYTLIQKWVDRGERKHFVVMRLKRADTILSSDAVLKLKAVGESFLGKPYDFFFEWKDDRIYCSELVWKAYDRALGIQLGSLQKMSEFDLSAKPVKKKLHERYGDKIPLGESVISPARIFESDLLTKVLER